MPPLVDTSHELSPTTIWDRIKVAGKKHRPIVLDGVWRPSDDPVEVIEDFVTMQNLYYGEKHPIPVAGMTATTTIPPFVATDNGTVFLCHCDVNPPVDSVGNHTLTSNIAWAMDHPTKWGNSLLFYNSYPNYIKTEVSPDFNASGGEICVDVWIYNFYIIGTYTIFSLVADANNYLKISLTDNLSSPDWDIVVNLVIDGTERIGATGLVKEWKVSGISPYMGKWTHVCFTQNLNDVYLFLDGEVVASDTISSSYYMPDMDAAIYWGVDQTGAANYFSNYMEEMRFGLKATYTAEFDVPTSPYPDASTEITSTPAVYASAQYINDRFSDSTILVQAAYADETKSFIVQNTTAIPNVGDFSNGTLYELGTEKGRFAKAPTNNIIFCNGEKNLIYGGSEVLPVGIINKASDGSFDYNFTSPLTNSASDVANSARIHNIPATVESNILSLFHLDGTTDNSSLTTRSITKSNMYFHSSIRVAGTHSGNFKRRASSYFKITTLTDYDLSGSSFTISRYVRLKDKLLAHPLFYQYTVGSEANDYMLLSLVLGVPTFKIVAGGVTKVTLTGVKLPKDQWHYVAVQRDKATNTYYLLVGRRAEKIEVVAEVVDADGPAAYDSHIYIGTDKSAGGNFANCLMDEIVDSNELLPLSIAGGIHLGLEDTGGVGRACELYISSSRPIDAIKPYIKVSNEQIQVISFDTGVVELVAGNVIIFESGGVSTILNVSKTSGSWGSTAAGSLTITAPATIPTALDDISIYVPDGDEAVYTLCANVTDPVVLRDLTPSINGNYWGENGWASIGTITDGTDVGGVPMVNTGLMEFASTVNVAKQTFVNGVKAYHYKFDLNNISDTTELYQITVRCPMQEITDIWDSVGIQLQKVWRYDETSNDKQYQDYTVNAAVQDYQPFPVVVDSTTMEVAYRITYINMASFGPKDELIIGSQKRLSGVIVYMAEKYNKTSNTTSTGYYFNGVEFTECKNYRDGTQKEGTSKSFAQTGYITWDSPKFEEEFKTRIKDEPYLYYYKIKVQAALDNTVRIDCLMGIPAEQLILPYKFPVGAWDVVYLCNNLKDRQNAVRPADPNTATVWRDEILVGTERALTAGCCIPGPLATAVTLMFKNTETWALIGRYPKLTTIQLSDTDGCTAPNTLRTTSVPVDISQKLQVTAGVAIWQGTNGVYISDGKMPIPIHWAIRKYFDPDDDACIPSTMIKESVGWMDNKKWRYHLRIASGATATTLNTELVFDFRKLAWSEVVRGTGNDIQLGLEVEDTYGNPYQYAFITDGNMMRLDYGTTFNGEDIIGTLRLGDIAVEGNDPYWETNLESIDILMTQKSVTENLLQINYYGDSALVSEALLPSSCDSVLNRLTLIHRNVNKTATYHGLEMTLTTDDESKSFEPLGINMHYSVVR